MLVWTDPAIPASVNLPVIIPYGPIVESTNVSLLCVAMGTPTPTLSLYVNGQLMRRDDRRLISYPLINVQRNLTSVGCYATNGYGKDAQSAQSTIQTLVRCKSNNNSNYNGYHKYKKANFQCHKRKSLPRNKIKLNS